MSTDIAADLAALPGPPTALDPIITSIATVLGYVGAAMGHDHPFTDQFDPVESMFTIENAAYDLMEATNRHTEPPTISRPTRDGAEAVEGARMALIATAREIIALGRTDEVTTAELNLLAATLGQLHEGYVQMFGENW